MSSFFEGVLFRFIVSFFYSESAFFTLLISIKLQSSHQLKICVFWVLLLQADGVTGSYNTPKDKIHPRYIKCRERGIISIDTLPFVSLPVCITVTIKHSSIKAVIAQPYPRKQAAHGFGSIMVTLHRVGEGQTVNTAGALAESQRHQGMFWETLSRTAQG